MEAFHPIVASWFGDAFESPTEAQDQAWPCIQRGENTLIAAPTGAGKTLAAFLVAIDRLLQKSLEGALANETSVVYVSPLKALSTDVNVNLSVPLEGIQDRVRARGYSIPPHQNCRTHGRYQCIQAGGNASKAATYTGDDP